MVSDPASSSDAFVIFNHANSTSSLTLKRATLYQPPGIPLALPFVFSLLHVFHAVLGQHQPSLPNITVAIITNRDVNFTQPAPGRFTSQGELRPLTNGDVVVVNDTTDFALSPQAGAGWYIEKRGEHTYTLGNVQNGVLQTLAVDKAIAAGSALHALNASANLTADSYSTFYLTAEDGAPLKPE